MSGASVTWVGLGEARDLLRGLTQKTDNQKPLMRAIGDVLLDSTTERIETTRTAPDGSKWDKLKNKTPSQKRYVAHKATIKNATLLRYSDDLLTGMVRHAYKNRVEVGSPEAYAATHQFGHGEIVARPFLGVSTKDNRVIKDLIVSYYQ